MLRIAFKKLFEESLHNKMHEPGSHIGEVLEQPLFCRDGTSSQNLSDSGE